MNTDTHKTASGANTWIIALITSVAINGLLAGVLLSKRAMPTDHNAVPSVNVNAGGGRQNAYINPRTYMRNLPADRRKTVLTSAVKHIRSNSDEHPRKLFVKLRKSRQHTLRIIKTEPLDTAALKTSLANTRMINDKLAVYSDALILEVLQQLTPEERRASLQAMRRSKANQKRKMKEKRKRKGANPP